MKHFVKSVLRPVSNRHYSDKKISVLIYVLRLLPVLLICIFGALGLNPVFWIVLLVIIVLGFVDYVVFDALLDKLSWKLFWRLFYSDELPEATPEHAAMKAFEVNSNQENREVLQKRLNNK